MNFKNAGNRPVRGGMLVETVPPKYYRPVGTGCAWNIMRCFYDAHVPSLRDGDFISCVSYQHFVPTGRRANLKVELA